MCTIRELLSNHLTYAREYYAGNRHEVSHLESISACIEATIDTSLPANEFSPKKLKAVRDMMIQGGWTLFNGDPAKPYTRRYINCQVNRLRGIFKWGVSEELVAYDVYSALMCVAALDAGRTTAKEGKGKVSSAPTESVEAVKRVVSEMVRDMIDIQTLSGMRSGELCSIRLCDIKMEADDWWTYAPQKHKTAYKGKYRLCHFGPQCIRILRKYIGLETTKRLFFYSPQSYRNAIANACIKAGVPHWHPHMNRHRAATTVRKAFGKEATTLWLGHSDKAMEVVYGEQDIELAATIARRIG